MPDWRFYRTAYEGLRQGLRLDYAQAQYLPGLYVLTALQSRGLTTAPFLGNALSRLMTGGPNLLDSDESALAHPARFTIRALKQQRELPPL